MVNAVLVSRQSMISRIAMHTKGVVIRGWIVGSAVGLTEALDEEWRRGQVHWWAPATIRWADGRERQAVVVDQRKAASRMAAALDGQLAELREDLLRWFDDADVVHEVVGCLRFGG